MHLSDIRTRDDLPLYINTISPEPQVAELGVARGAYSRILADRLSANAMLYLVDRWSDHHDLREQKAVESRFSDDPRVWVIKATFEAAAHMFTDGEFDAVYIDGYAHTGQDGGKTLEQWYPLLRSGGLFCGHDYHRQWQPTIDAVDAFKARVAPSATLHLTMDDEYPSWAWIKP